MSRGLGDVYKRQGSLREAFTKQKGDRGGVLPACLPLSWAAGLGARTGAVTVPSALPGPQESTLPTAGLASIICEPVPCYIHFMCIYIIIK